MQVSVTVEYLGRQYELTLKADVPEDLSAFNVKSRITAVLDREAQRCAEITAVALQDKAVAEAAEAEALERKRQGIVLEKGPAMVLAAGTKDPSGRVIVGEAKE